MPNVNSLLKNSSFSHNNEVEKCCECNLIILNEVPKIVHVTLTIDVALLSSQ